MTLDVGIHLDVPMLDYLNDPCASPSLSHGVLEAMVNQSAAHARAMHPKLNPEREPENNSVMDAGSVAHHLLLGGDTREVVVVQAADWRTKAAQDERDAAWANGGIPVLVGNMERIHRMVEAAREFIARSELPDLFDDSKAKSEVTMIWRTPAGVLCRGRVDRAYNDFKILVDYKSTGGSAEPESWIRNHLIPDGHDLQAEFYCMAPESLRLAHRSDFVFLVQENKPPFACSLIGVAPAFRDLAARKIDFGLALWKGALDQDRWPPYPTRIHWAEPPEYASRSWDERENRLSLDERIDLGGQG